MKAESTTLRPVTSVEEFLPSLPCSDELPSLAKARKSIFEFQSVHPADVDAETDKGWELQRAGKTRARLRRPKPHKRMLEDRVWCLLQSMGYSQLNSAPLKISFKRENESQGNKYVDVLAIDDETAFVIECKSREDRGRRSLQKDLEETISLQSFIRKSIYELNSGRTKPKVIWAYVTRNIIWSEPDIDRATDSGISIITENELQYFEAFIKHMGPAGKYQILGEFLRGQKVPGLADIKLPAIRGKIGGQQFYSFVVSPKNLLKIAFVNHQALNHPDGKPAYQRMVSSSRIKEIGKFIEKGGFFPTNILINFTESPKFELISNKENVDANIKFGWITLPNQYRSAWIIDGQHRLYGYSKLPPKFLDQSLFVLAFDQMDTHKEADLFITINHKQKSVPNSLLVSLLADIRMGDSDPSTALTALSSGVVRALNTDRTSPLSRRFSVPGVPAEPTQNLTVSEAVNGLRRSGLIGRVKGKKLIPGVLSDTTDEKTIERSRRVLNAYFEKVRTANPARWEGGQSAFVSVNPGIRAHLSVIAEIVAYLTEKKKVDPATWDPDKLSNNIASIAAPIFEFISEASDDLVKEKFSRKFGEGGVREYTYALLALIHESHDDFGSDEFQRWIYQTESEKIEEANQFIMKLAEKLTDHVIETLKQVHGTHRLGSGEQAFWEIGVESERVRKNAYDKQQKDKSRRKPKEAYLDIVDLIEIAKQSNNWPHLELIFNNPMPSERAGQKYYVKWVQNFNELRNIAAHKNQLKTYTDDDLEFIDWLRTTVAPKLGIGVTA